ncbi:MAG: metal-dependent transcriptional regulator [Acidimicrobiia bacterium]
MDVRLSDEEYLQTILELEEDGIVPIRARLAERLNISAAATSEAVPRLVERGYLFGHDGRTLELTPLGRELGTAVVRRHRLAERFLVDVLRLPWEKAHLEASRWEHVLSGEVEAHIVSLLGDPATCPHGNPIPGSKQAEDTSAATSLAAAAPGPGTVQRISEQIQTDDSAIAFLVAAALTPGTAIEVASAASDGVTVHSPSGEHLVAGDLAELVWVTAP